MLLNPETIKEKKLAALDACGASITYGELLEEGGKLAELTEPRAVIFCMCDNSIAALLGYVGFYDHGRVCLLLDANLDSGLFQHLANIYKPQYVWFPESASPSINLKEVVRLRSYVLGKTGWPAYDINEHLSLLLTTSGSTGSPKLVRHKYGNLEANSRNVAKAFGWSAEERPICSLPMHYTMGLNVINTHLYVGATLLLSNLELTDRKFWQFIKEKKGTNFTGVPYSYEILQKLRFMSMDLPSLSTFCVGGGRMTEENFMEMAAYANTHNKRFISSFGTTETSARMACLQPEFALDKCCSIGKAIPEGILFLKDEHGTPVPNGEGSGELCYQGPNVTMGYAENAADLLLGDIFNGEYETGDLAKRDVEGFYYITGRLKRFVKIYGLRISLDQCERIIKNKFNIECACTGTDRIINTFLSDKNMMDEIKTYLCKTLNITPSSLAIHYIENIPKNSFGKTLYNALIIN